MAAKLAPLRASSAFTGAASPGSTATTRFAWRGASMSQM
jgi:hypothetical protein